MVQLNASGARTCQDDARVETAASDRTMQSWPAGYFGGALPSLNRQNPFEASAPNPFVANLARFGRLDPAEVDALMWVSRNPRRHRAEQILIHEGSPVDHISLLVQGFACRYKIMADGRRQILGYLLPGDLCDVHFAIFNKPDHSVVCLTDCAVVSIPIHAVSELGVRFPKIARALALTAAVDSCILREWLLNIGQRRAMQRLGHLFCELALRLNAIGKVAVDGSFDLPILQGALADTTGLTPVHVNRTLQRLRSSGLISLSQRRLTILDFERLKTVAGFDGAYLHIETTPTEWRVSGHCEQSRGGSVLELVRT